MIMFSTFFINMMMDQRTAPSSPRDAPEIQRRDDAIVFERETSSDAAERRGGEGTKNVPTGSPHASLGARSLGEHGGCACN